MVLCTLLDTQRASLREGPAEPSSAKPGRGSGPPLRPGLQLWALSLPRGQDTQACPAAGPHVSDRVRCPASGFLPVPARPEAVPGQHLFCLSSAPRTGPLPRETARTQRPPTQATPAASSASPALVRAEAGLEGGTLQAPGRLPPPPGTQGPLGTAPQPLLPGPRPKPASAQQLWTEPGTPAKSPPQTPHSWPASLRCPHKPPTALRPTAA